MGTFSKLNQVPHPLSFFLLFRVPISSLCSLSRGQWAVFQFGIIVVILEHRPITHSILVLHWQLSELPPYQFALNFSQTKAVHKPFGLAPLSYRVPQPLFIFSPTISLTEKFPPSPTHLPFLSTPMFPLLHAWSESPAQLSAAHSSASTEGTEVPSEQNLISTTTATLWSPMARAHDPKKLKTACSTALSTVVVEIPTSAGEIKSDGPKEGSSAMHVNAGSDCGEAVPVCLTARFSLSLDLILACSFSSSCSLHLPHPLPNRLHSTSSLSRSCPTSSPPRAVNHIRRPSPTSRFLAMPDR